MPKKIDGYAGAATARKRAKWKTGPKLQTKIGSMDHFRYDKRPSVIMEEKASDGQSLADRELKRMVKGDVFRSNRQTVKQTNSHPRRYKWGPSKQGRNP